MPSITDHLDNGLTIVCADGAEVQCTPLLLRDAKFFMQKWDEIAGAEGDGDQARSVRTQARLDIATRFGEIYPQLEEHIGLGDVEVLLPAFFYRVTGAHVRNGDRSTGTASGPNISLPPINSPT